MGTNQTAKRPTQRVSKTITNFKLRITNAGLRVRSSLFLCLLFVFSANVFGQNLENLVEIINRGSIEQKRDALLQIRNLETAEASRIAVPALKDSSEIVRATAAFSVVFLPKDEAFVALSPLLQDKSALVRRETADALGKVGNPNAVNSLLQTIQKDKILEVRNAAIVALGEIGEVAAVPELTKILQRKPTAKEDVRRRSAARSIGQIAQIIQTGGTKVITPENFLSDEFKRIETPKYPNLSEQFPVFRLATETLIRVLQNPNEADDTKRETAFALGAVGDAAATAVLRANLNAEDYYLREICRESLLKINRTKIIRQPEKLN
ncbi:MAG: HEAT repeat domain-containing protein [Pyrinomonadaceae bacterium]|nr:HEAT repeat domain-containing protein [Pyrinomonadaceae bacterium]